MEPESVTSPLLTMERRAGSANESLSSDLLSWFDLHQRDLPWRRDRDPYRVWVSEIMLQQTQVATVISYYQRWMERFPTVRELASADEQEVLALWAGLGYYRRCRMLLEGAHVVAASGMPSSFTEWRQVPGVGDYTAAAIASICHDEPVPVVDGNVERVFARVNACGDTGSALKRSAKEWMEQHLDRNKPGDFNQAVMELGATVCKPVSPRCECCPIAPHCIAMAELTTGRYPAKAARPGPVRLHQIVAVPESEGLFGVRQIEHGPWWRGMWEFPRTDQHNRSEIVDLLGLEGWSEIGKFVHTVTKHRVEVELFLVRCQSKSRLLEWVSPADLDQLPMPAPQRKAFRIARRAYQEVLPSRSPAARTE